MHNPRNVATSRSVRIGPNRRESLPKIRKGLSHWLIFWCSFFFFFVSIFCSQGNLHFFGRVFNIFCVTFLLLILVELFLRVLYAVEEWQHIETRYKHNVLTCIKNVFSFANNTTIYFITLCSFFTYVIMYMMFNKCPFKLWYEMGISTIICSSINAFLLQQFLNLKSGFLYESYWIENCPGLDYGSGMAHNFFNGYLKLIIPDLGNSEKYLQELMKDYEDRHRVKLACYKLFILIPKSLYCPTSLKTDDSPSIEESSSLEEKVMTVAGVQNRVYKNSVYKIKAEDGRKIYVAAEYATPLKTFKDVVSQSGEHSPYYKRHQNDIILQFYLTLKKVLKEEKNCRNFCELIFYDDMDESGHFKDVGQILLRRISKLRSENRLDT